MRKLFAIGTMALLQFVACGLIPLVSSNPAGSGTEITNGIVGRVYYPGGKAAAGATVIPRKIDYLSDTLYLASPSSAPGRKTMTDDSGAFAIDSIDTGYYSIEINDRRSNAVLLRCVVRLADSVVKVSHDTLRPAGAIRGVVAPSLNNPGPVYVFVHGMERVARIDPLTGNFSLLDMPSGSYILSVAAAVSPAASIVVGGASVTPGTATTLDTLRLPVNGGWAFSKKLVLNTTASGADIAGMVTDFPLLVRLNAANFDFGKARSGGADIRFAKASGKQLPCEIERWDPVAKRAEVWVRIDTVFGNDSIQSLWMYWGNVYAAAVSNGPAVFDSAGGFQGVWHLADADATPQVKDATGKNNGVMKSGTAEVNTSSTCSDGVVGNAVGLGGTEFQHWIDLGANRAFINNKRELTVSAWMYADAASFESGDLLSFSKGEVVDTLASASRVSLSANAANFLLSTTPAENGGTYAKLLSTQTYSLKTWIHVVGVVNVFADSMYVYGNGKLWNAQAVQFTEQATSPTNSIFSAIGSNDIGQKRYFHGKIDEARIEGVARTPDWIRLNYENLREGGKLIK